MNRDPQAAQIAHLRQQLAASRSEVMSLRRQLAACDGGCTTANAARVAWDGCGLSAQLTDPVVLEALEQAQTRIAELDMANMRLKVELVSTQSFASCFWHFYRLVNGFEVEQFLLDLFGCAPGHERHGSG